MRTTRLKEWLNMRVKTFAALLELYECDNVEQFTKLLTTNILCMRCYLDYKKHLETLMTETKTMACAMFMWKYLIENVEPTLPASRAQRLIIEVSDNPADYR